MLKKIKFKKLLLTTVFALVGLFANNHLFSLNQSEDIVLEQLQSNYTNKIQNIEQELSQHNVKQAKEDIAELTKLIENAKKELINEFIQNQENKSSNDIIPSIVDGYMETTNHLKGQILLSILGIIPGTFKGEFLNRIEGFNQHIKNAFSMKTYRNWKFFAMFASQSIIKNLPGFLKLVSLMSLSIYATRCWGIPYSTFSMAMAPFHGIAGTVKSIFKRRKTKKIVRNDMLQKFKKLNTLLSQLKNLSESIG